MKIPSLLPRKKLRAATARRSLGGAAEMDYEEMSEPNMKLSRALLIVLVLHVVAVAGIIAFNTIKTRQAPLPTIPNAASKASAAAEKSTPELQAESRPDSTITHTPSKSAAKEEPRVERAKPVEPAETYTVLKGDNPAKIAKKLKVSHDSLIALNHIDDPHKLKVGSKLLIPPTKTAKSKKPESK